MSINYAFARQSVGSGFVLFCAIRNDDDAPPPLPLSSKLKLCAAAELTECTSDDDAAPCCQNFPSFSRLWLEELVVGATPSEESGTHNHKQGHVSYQKGGGEGRKVFNLTIVPHPPPARFL